MATKAMSLVRGWLEIDTYTAKVDSETKKGTDIQVKFWTADKTPIFLSVANSKSLRIKLIYYSKQGVNYLFDFGFFLFTLSKNGASQA